MHDEWYMMGIKNDSLEALPDQECFVHFFYIEVFF